MRRLFNVPKVLPLLVVVAIVSLLLSWDDETHRSSLDLVLDEKLGAKPRPRVWNIEPNATPPVSPSDWSATKVFKQIDSGLQQLAEGRGVLVAPREMTVGDTTRVLARLARTGHDENLFKGMPPGLIHEWRETGIAPTMKARLMGAGFDIENVSSEEQPIGGGTHTEWSWLVTPQLAGDRELLLQISAVVSVSGFEKTKDVLVRTHRVYVRVSPKRWIADFFGVYGGKAVAFALGAIALAMWRQIRARWRRAKQRSRSRIISP